MKIIFVLHSHKAGGAERHLYQLMSGLRTSGIECLYAGPLDGWLGQQLQGAGFRCEHIPYHGIYDVVSLLRLAKLIRREKADLVHGHLTRGALYAGWAAKLAKVPSVATAHSTNAGKHFGRASRIIAVSDAVAHFLRECGYAGQCICTVHNGVPDQAIQEPQAAHGAWAELKQEGEPIITMVARLEKVKGHDLALRALATLTSLRWKLVLAGSTDTPWAKEVQALARELGIEHRVHSIGHTDDIPSVYAITDILIAPSRREAFSLTLLEAASFSLPIIATKVGGNSEAVLDRETGILVEPENSADLATALKTLLGDAGMRHAMGQKGRKRYETSFSSHTMVQKTIAVYRELIQGI